MTRPAGTPAMLSRLAAGTAIWRAAGIIVLLAGMMAFPFAFPNQLVTTIAVDTLIFLGAAAAWNIFSGFSGYISLAHGVFFGCGAYAAGIVCRDWNLSGDVIFALLPLAGLVAAVVAIPFGLIALRVRRHTFLVVTIAIFFIFQLMAFNFGFTGGTTGISAPFLFWSPATYNDPFYFTALMIAVGTVTLSWLIRRSRFGLQLRAIRDDEGRVRSLGVRTMRVKLAALVVSAFPVGMLGALWFYFITQVLPASGFDPAFDLALALMAFLGGLGTVSGPVLGALLIEPAQQYVIQQFPNDYISQILLGVLFLAVIVLMPRGLIPTVGERITSWRSRPGKQALPGAAAGAGRSSARNTPAQETPR
jgi:branched-chain amino acid transport system permease protein